MSRTFLASLTSLSFAVSFASLFPTDSVSFAETQKDAANTSVSPKKEDEKPEITTYPDVSSALSAVLERAEKDAGKKPRLVAFGEYHQLKGKTHIRSALKRFTDDLFPLVKSLASDLVLETFIPEGNCGKQEKQVVKDVETTTKRPETTESELVTLIKQAKAQGVQPHILQVSCKDYQSVLDEQGQVDYVKMLKLVNDLLQKRISDIRTRRTKAGVDKVVLAYGGALHNDLYPQQELAEYTFGKSLSETFPDEYLEIDLYVPEYIEKDKQILSQTWYPLFKKIQKQGQFVVVRRGPGSFIVLFPSSGTTNKPEKPQKTPK
jgi:hypothetical protein